METPVETNNVYKSSSSSDNESNADDDRELTEDEKDLSSESESDTNSENSYGTESQRNLVLVYSRLSADQVKLVQLFVKRFNAKCQYTFSMDVTHVIISTKANTKVGQKTLKYIQGIAFQKYVLNFQWIVDCLDNKTLLDEEDEKYEVLDEDIFESGSKKSRNWQQDLFGSFAIYCLQPMVVLSITEFKNILTFNGAVVVNNVAQLAAHRNKYRVIILPDDYDLDEKTLSDLKKAQCTLVSFNWIVDSISQYHTISLTPYLEETDPEELLALGFPVEYFVDDEFEEEEEGDNESNEDKKSTKTSYKVSEATSNADVPKIQRRSTKTSTSSSTLSSVKERNSESEESGSNVKNKRKKKRAHSDPSNDDKDLDVTSIIGEWSNNPNQSVQMCKKVKVVPSTGNNLITNPDKNKNKLIQTEDGDGDGDVNLVGDEKMLQRDPPIDDISKVKSFKEVEPSTSKLTTIPSSLMSADLFESNEPCMQPSAQISPKQANSSEVLDNTLIDFIQNSRKKSNLSESSDGSNKENTESNYLFC